MALSLVFDQEVKDSPGGSPATSGGFIFKGNYLSVSSEWKGSSDRDLVDQDDLRDRRVEGYGRSPVLFCLRYLLCF